MGFLDMEGSLNFFASGALLMLRCFAPVLCIILMRTQAENADEWSYQKGLEGGWIPQDPTDRMYPGICSESQD